MLAPTGTISFLMFSKSMPDYLMRWLASRFLDVDLQEELGILTTEVRARKAAQDVASSQLGNTAGPSVPSSAAAPIASAARPAPAAFTDEPPVLPVVARGLYLGPACQQCGGMMQRSGSCYTCGSCGFNTGCG